jgi:hypothetical protein
MIPRGEFLRFFRGLGFCSVFVFATGFSLVGYSVQPSNFCRLTMHVFLGGFWRKVHLSETTRRVDPVLNFDLNQLMSFEGRMVQFSFLGHDGFLHHHFGKLDHSNDSWSILSVVNGARWPIQKNQHFFVSSPLEWKKKWVLLEYGAEESVVRFALGLVEEVDIENQKLVLQKSGPIPPLEVPFSKIKSVQDLSIFRGVQIGKVSANTLLSFRNPAHSRAQGVSEMELIGIDWDNEKFLFAVDNATGEQMQIELKDIDSFKTSYRFW